jgi:glycogen phosphorylase
LASKVRSDNNENHFHVNQLIEEKINPASKPAVLKEDILENLYFIQGKLPVLATLNDWYVAVAYTVRDRLMKNWISSLTRLNEKDLKIVGYLSAEFLMGPHLGNALVNLDIYEEVKLATEQLGLDFEQLLKQEEEPGLGNGGLGRLAACFLDSMTTLKVPAVGYGLRYEFGIFDQQIQDGWQVEATDKWLRLGNPWEIVRPEVSFNIKFGGHTEVSYDPDGKYRARWIPAYEVKGVAHDTPVPGYKNDTVNLLRLWKSEAIQSFNFQAFNVGDYYGAVNEKIRSETISKVLYPNDEPETGKRLRLSQQYFFVSCSIQDVLRIQRLRGLAIENLPASMAIQMNDTHPSIAVAELMRILVDENLMDWDKAWDITQRSLSYTNHTLLPEALEKWPLSLFASLLPRHLEIIYEINSRFLGAARLIYADSEFISRLSIIDETGERYVRMANLATIGSHAVNGVSALHTELLKQDVMKDFYKLSPAKFFNVTNGVTPRRWIKLYNPRLADLITRNIGEDWIKHLEEELSKLSPLAGDPAFQRSWQRIKYQNKADLSKLIKEITGITVDPNSMFDVQVKRIHEYKRQLLNVLHIITLYNRIKNNPGIEIIPRTFIFGGKAAPGYLIAKLIIKLVNSVAEIVNSDKDVRDRLKVVFFPDFNVKNSEHIYRAADLSEQISTAGKEASGTGNMKFSMNGALTIGTYDGANVEILDAVGMENFFLFGLKTQQVQELKKLGYHPIEVYDRNPELKEVLNLLQSGLFSRGDQSLFKPILNTLLEVDTYLVLEDYQSYMECQQKVSDAYTHVNNWTKMTILNVAGMGKFSSDRSIREYCEKIWHVKMAQ